MVTSEVDESKQEMSKIISELRKKMREIDEMSKELETMKKEYEKEGPRKTEKLLEEIKVPALELLKE